MFDHLDNEKDASSQADAIDFFDELDRNTPAEIRARRGHFRVMIKAGVTMCSGNTSELRDYKVKGVTGDISQGGCALLLPIPARVGDVYRLDFERAKIDLPTTFARCVRAYLVREDAFECGFRFFSTISLPNNLEAAAEAQTA